MKQGAATRISNAQEYTTPSAIFKPFSSESATRSFLAQQLTAGSSPAGKIVTIPIPLPWRNELDRIRSIKDNWNGYGSRAPNLTALRYSQDVLDALHNAGELPSNIAPCADEGVTITISRPKCYGIIECYNEGDIVAAFSIPGKTREIWEVGTTQAEIKEAVNHIIKLIDGNR